MVISDRDENLLGDGVATSCCCFSLRTGCYHCGCACFVGFVKRIFANCCGVFWWSWFFPASICSPVSPRVATSGPSCGHCGCGRSCPWRAATKPRDISTLNGVQCLWSCTVGLQALCNWNLTFSIWPTFCWICWWRFCTCWFRLFVIGLFSCIPATRCIVWISNFRFRVSWRSLSSFALSTGVLARPFVWILAISPCAPPRTSRFVGYQIMFVCWIYTATTKQPPPTTTNNDH